MDWQIVRNPGAPDECRELGPFSDKEKAKRVLSGCRKLHHKSVKFALKASRETVIHEATDKTPRVVETDRALHVSVHPDASMAVPRTEWLWTLRYSTEPDRGTQCSDRMLSASVLDSYRYLIMECSKEEAWARIKQMRRAVTEYDQSDQNTRTAEVRDVPASVTATGDESPAADGRFPSADSVRTRSGRR